VPRTHSHRPVPAQHDRPLWPSDSSTRRSFACSAGRTQLAAEYARHERVVGVGDVVADEHVCDRFPRASAAAARRLHGEEGHR
jgi:hypothetical protein